MSAPQWSRDRVRDVAAGAAAGILLTSLVAALVAALAWPETSRTGADQGGAPPAVSVPPAPTTDPTPVPAATEPTATPEEVEEEDGGEPSEAPVLPNAAPAGTGPLPETDRVDCPPATTTVSSAEELEAALDDAAPGDSIALAEGTYSGEFVASASGTEADPIFLCGPADAVLDGGDVEGGYTFHLDGATHWRLVGFTVSGGQKGVMADGTVGSVIQGLTVTGTGDEAIHLRSHSTDNAVLDNTIRETGLRNEEYGEGVYIGSAVSNWCTYTGCEADRSDRNVIDGNTISKTTSEAIDLKEGTTGGVVSGNTFDGSSLSGADSWVDVKGNNYLIEGNTGTHATEDGFQTHQILDGWGDHNVFTGNHADVQGPGHAIASWPEESNVVRCDNTFTDAGEGLSNIPCG
ncbi:right-handed parallel beta-helix repeat-containing protein [Nocardioides campestrisoli]|uniref:right-handed parallel beta-helix repeat-containing protein n=1 Tax=Nocardioides campestrisoli TaxID=2736757 RepID=UPI0015E7717E|nr:right-handed parallel beta-helix repeat-containing protein [Nocardioides campestrisoli]